METMINNSNLMTILFCSEVSKDFFRSALPQHRSLRLFHYFHSKYLDYIEDFMLCAQRLPECVRISSMSERTKKANANYGHFYAHEGRYYLKNYEYRLAFCLRGQRWESVDFDSVAPFDMKTMAFEQGWEGVEDKDIESVFRDLLPEPDICEKTDLENRKRYLDRLDKMSKTTPRRVIGWISDYSLSAVRECEDDDLSHYAAFFAYIKQNGYSFSGEQYQNLDAEPLFDDYTYLSFSRRGFGYLMALAHGNLGRYDYAGFTEFALDDDSKTPLVDSLKGIDVVTDIELDESQSEIFLRLVEPRIETGEDVCFAMSVEAKENLYYWPQGIVFVRGESCQYRRITLVKDAEGRDKALDELEGTGEMVFLDDIKKRDSFPFVLLALSAS